MGKKRKAYEGGSVCVWVGGWFFFCFFFQAEDGIRGLVRSRGLGDVYKRPAIGRSITRR